jgi:hypothetical protein
MPPGSGLQARPRAPHSPARSGYACRAASVIGRDSKAYVTETRTHVNGTRTHNSAPAKGEGLSTSARKAPQFGVMFARTFAAPIAGG